MKVTYFIRDNNETYPELCDVASVKIKKGTKIYYFGCQWGEHNPTNTIEYIVADSEEIQSYQWLNNLGYEFIPPQS